MDWGHVIFAAEEGLPGIAALAITLAVFGLSAAPGRTLLACSPSLAALLAFAVSCVVAGVPRIETSSLAGGIPVVGFLTTIALLAPSVIALRSRWVGLLHVLTVLAALYLGFIGLLAISHDAT